MTALLDRTVGTIVDAHGQPATLPTTLIGADAAAILRNYFFWACAQQLEPELFCASCYDGTRDSKALYNINERDIQIICRCQLRFFQGAWLTPDPVGTSQSAPVDATGPIRVQLSAGAARLLRLYKRVLADLGLKEALRCNACYALSQDDGCDAQVLTTNIRIRCRCSNRTYQGISI